MRDGLPQRTVLIVDDQADLHAVVGDLLVKDYRLLRASDAASAIASIDRDEPDLVLLDLDLGKGPDGFTVLEHLRQGPSDLPVVVLSNATDTDSIVRAMQLGAAHYLAKPPRYDELQERLRLAFADRRRQFAAQAHRLPKEEVVGSSPAIQEVRALARAAARDDIPVLLRGESGTGKGLVARCIHRWSARNAGPYCAMNIAGSASTLIDSELFGHERGAFTGADIKRRGLFELTDGGTILFDEIGDLAKESQVKLLRVVEEGTFTRIGSERTMTADVRVLAATHADLEEMIQTGTFRSDLYYRLAGMTIVLPPLRERRNDIPELVEAYFGRRDGLTAAALDELMGRAWPGNVRELYQNLHRAAVLAQGATVDLAHLARGAGAAPGASAADAFALPYEEATALVLDRFRKDYLTRLLQRCKDNRTLAAKQSGLSRSHLYTLLESLGLDRRS